jgi:hypothetical protein
MGRLFEIQIQIRTSAAAKPKTASQKPAAHARGDVVVFRDRNVFLSLMRFLDANRWPPRIKCGAGFRLKTL